VAIHCEPLSEPHPRTRPSGHDGLPRSSRWSLLAMTECVYCHCEGVARGVVLFVLFRKIRVFRVEKQEALDLNQWQDG
jgi:hypothetical protein